MRPMAEELVSAKRRCVVLVPEIPGWLVIVGGSAVGLGVGVLFGALVSRGKKNVRKPSARPVEARGSQTTMLANPSAFANDSGAANSQLPGRAESPQQRLLERLRESNLDLSAQLRASAAQHARLLKEKDEEVAALKDDFDQRVEELRQSQSSELKYLMALLVEQVDSIHKSHANHVRALEAEMDRLRQGGSRHRPSADDGADTTTFAMTEAMDSSIKRAH
jgi:hypothetical protein